MRRSSSSSSGSSTRWNEFYRDEIDLLKDQALHAGVREILNFEFPGPPARRPLNECEPTEEMDSETAKVLAQAAEIAVAYSFGGPKRWRVVARLETKGVDLADSEKVYVRAVCEKV